MNLIGDVCFVGLRELANKCTVPDCTVHERGHCRKRAGLTSRDTELDPDSAWKLLPGWWMGSEESVRSLQSEKVFPGRKDPGYLWILAGDHA